MSIFANNKNDKETREETRKIQWDALGKGNRGKETEKKWMVGTVKYVFAMNS